MKITPIILCGGSGTRLWPLSRQHYPKQFLKLDGDTTLFQQSVSRAIALENKKIQIEEILIVTNESHRFLVLEQLDELKLNVPTRILLESEPKNTAPALTLATLAAIEKNSESILVVTPADHFVKDYSSFILAMHAAIHATKNKTIVTLGIQPSRPDTGFGYIEYQGKELVKDVIAFKEKPDMKTAKVMIAKSQHAWNSGMFILQSKTWINAIAQSNKEISDSLAKSWQLKSSDQWFVRPDAKYFKKSPSDSIDYAVMEHTKILGINTKLVLLNAGWSDLGSFSALDEIKPKDNDGNIFKGDIVNLNTKNTIAIASSKNLSLLGVNNLIVIETEDSILVASKDDAQSIKKLVKILEKKHKTLLVDHTKVNRPWGWFDTIDEGDNFKVKRIQINPKKSISLQKHQQRSEHWVVIKGEATITKDDKIFILKENESVYIKKNQIHRISNQTNKITQIIEVQSGDYLGEDDIERFEDIFGRVKDLC
jgi:mannose-1-phosphate guanylyltransferase / mannose-6-phosphate isomerase